MAREAGLIIFLPMSNLPEIEHFADLVAKFEREACAQKVEKMGIEGYGTLAIAASIRAQNSQK
jgi:uncharacterized protein (DUF2126 family)